MLVLCLCISCSPNVQVQMTDLSSKGTEFKNISFEAQSDRNDLELSLNTFCSSFIEDHEALVPDAAIMPVHTWPGNVFDTTKLHTANRRHFSYSERSQ